MHVTTLRRGVGRACLASAAAVAVLAFVAPPVLARNADESGGPRPQVFSGAASALAASVQLDRQGLLPVPELFRFMVAEGNGVYQSSDQQARASLIFPGNGLILGPALACGQFPPEARPVFGPIIDACLQYAFPLSVNADSLTPDGSTEGSIAMGTPSDPLSTRAVGASAHAGPDAVTTAAQIGDLDVLGAPAVGPLPAVPGMEDLEPYVLAIGSATATTDQRIDEAGALVVDAESAMSDVRILGGLVRIASLVSRARVVDGDGEPVTETTLDLSGITLAGMPARITDRGLEVATASQPLGPATDALAAQLQALLESLAFEIETLPAERGIDDDGISFASVGGVLISMRVPVDGLPAVPGPLGDLDFNGEYVGSIVLGQAGARGIANNFDRAVPAPRPPIAGAVPGLSTGVSDSVRVPAGSPTAAPGAPTAAAVPGGDSTEVASEAAGFVGELFADRLRLLYLAFTLAALGICLAPRLTVPARLPGSGR